MAILANSISHGGIRAASAVNGYYPHPVEMYLWLTENDSYPSGGVIGPSRRNGADVGNFAGNADGEMGLLTTVDTVGALADDLAIGVLPKMSPRRQDLTPLTSATAPATALPGQRTLPASITPDFANPADEDGGGQVIYPFIPGQIFAGHLVAGAGAANGGADLIVTAAHMMRGPTDTSFSITITGAPAGTSEEIVYSTKADECVLVAHANMNNHAFTIGFANPQPITWLTTASVNALNARRFSIDTVQSNQLVFFTVVAAGSILF